MAAYFNLNSNEILRELSVNKVNMILDKQGRIVLNEQSISSPHKETQRSPQFFSTSKYLATNTSQFKTIKTLPAWTKSSNNSTFDFGDNEATTSTSLQCTSKKFDRETFLTELQKFPSFFGLKIIPIKNRDTWKSILQTNE